jgi:hypothetical protein
MGAAAVPGGGPNLPLPLGTGLVVGQAVEADSTRPIPGALVTLMLPGAAPLRVLADGQGRFAFRDLPKGRFNITATKPGHVDGAYGRQRPQGPSTPLELTEGEKMGGLSLWLWRHGAVAGTVVDEAGEPVAGAQVRVLKRAVVGGQWKLTSGPMDLTDDRGAYRIGQLEPGEYIVVVPSAGSTGFPGGALAGASVDRLAAAEAERAEFVVRATATAGGGGGAAAPMIVMAEPGGSASAGTTPDGALLAFPTQFYPAAVSASRATPIAVGSGEERTGLDFHLKAVRTAKVGGVVAGPEGPAGDLVLTLLPADSDDLSTPLEEHTAFSDATGAFSFPAVPPGQYVLRASRQPRMGISAPNISDGPRTMVMITRTVGGNVPPPLPAESTLWSEMAVAVGGADITDLSIALRPGLKVNGMVEFQGGAARPSPEDLQRIGVSLEPAESRPGAGGARGRVEATGQFTTMGVPAGKYFVRVAGAPQGWSFRAAMFDGQDASDTPIEIGASDVTGVLLSFTDRPTELRGQVALDASAEAVSVMVFPTDRERWVGYGATPRRLRTTRADRLGNFVFTNLPAGDYFIIAVPDKTAADWQSPKFLEEVALDATRLHLADGEKLSQTIKVRK